jgi:hypothetical protein
VALREKRLRSDAAALARVVTDDGPIRLIDSQGDPPERYVLDYHVDGLVVQGNEVVPAAKHRVEVFLTLAYPRQAPQCRMMTPIFHPNIAPHAVCIGDHWSAGESLPALLVRIAEMICLQSYNVKSPLNGDAARWVEEHVDRLPLSHEDYRRLLGDASEPVSLAPTFVPVPVAVPAPVATAPVATSLVAAGDESPAGPSGDLTVSCTICGSAVSVPPGIDGAWLRCPMCGRIFQRS